MQNKLVSYKDGGGPEHDLFNMGSDGVVASSISVKFTPCKEANSKIEENIVRLDALLIEKEEELEQLKASEGAIN